MDEIKEILQTQLAGTIDFKGQQLAEKYTDIIIYAGCFLSVAVGFIAQEFQYTVIILITTYIISLIFSLPIPAYRRNPVTWLEPSNADIKEVKINL